MSNVIVEGDGNFPMDLRVPITTAQVTSNGVARVIARGEFRDREVGIEISIRGQMKPGLIGDEIDKTAFYANGVVLRGMGDLTRNLVETLSEIYMLPIHEAKPLDHLSLTSFALAGDPTLIKNEHLNFKVFHDDEDKMGLYFEMFFHIDIAEGYVRFDEKDEEYRENVLRSFSALRPLLT